MADPVNALEFDHLALTDEIILYGVLDDGTAVPMVGRDPVTGVTYLQGAEGGIELRDENGDPFLTQSEQNAQDAADAAEAALAGLAAAVPTYDAFLKVPGRPGAGEEVLWIKAVRAFTIAAALAGWQTGADVAATASAVFSVKKNGVEIGTLTFAAAATVATLAGAGGSLAIGDVLTIVAPLVQDATLEGVGIGVKGQL